MTFEYPLKRLFGGEKEIIKMIGRKREKKPAILPWCGIKGK